MDLGTWPEGLRSRNELVRFPTSLEVALFLQRAPDPLLALCSDFSALLRSRLALVHFSLFIRWRRREEIGEHVELFGNLFRKCFGIGEPHKPMKLALTKEHGTASPNR